MSEVTRILAQVESGDPQAAERLLPLVYDELRKLAAQKLSCEIPGQTLQATALVHEAYLRLVDDQGDSRWDGRGHFFAAAAEAMRRILIDRARQKGRVKHGGRYKRIDVDTLNLATEATAEQLLAIIDTRSDIYSLGVLLYELLTGTTPFGKERFKRVAYDEICRIIREEDPPKPSTRLSQMRSVERGVFSDKTIPQFEFRIVNFKELDWIVRNEVKICALKIP